MFWPTLNLVTPLSWWKSYKTFFPASPPLKRPNKLERLFHGKPLQTDLIFAGDCLLVELRFGQAMDLFSNFRLGWKGFVHGQALWLFWTLHQ
jgi:hypothetical protein